MYASYIVTPEEYQGQRYEAAFTPFGPHTLTCYIDQFKKLGQALVNGSKVPAGPNPPVLDDRVISTQLPVLFDGTPSGQSFGSVIGQPLPNYNAGDSVEVVFVSGNPRNNLQHEGSYFNVERRDHFGAWDVVFNDADWETKFVWQQTNQLSGHSSFTATWDIPEDVESGVNSPFRNIQKRYRQIDVVCGNVENIFCA